MTNKPRDTRVDVIGIEAIDNAFSKLRTKPTDKDAVAMNDDRAKIKERIRVALFPPNQIEIYTEPSIEELIVETVNGIVSFATFNQGLNKSDRSVRKFPTDVDKHVMGFSTLLNRRKQRSLFAHEMNQLRMHMENILTYLKSLE